MFTELGKTSIRIKQNPIIFFRHIFFLSNQNFQTVGQLSSNNSEDFAKTVLNFVHSDTAVITLIFKQMGLFCRVTHFILMSLVMRKQAFCICENKDADQLRINCTADQRLCFRYTDSTTPLLPKYEISSL